LSKALSLIHGPPLDSEVGQGAQTIPAYLEEVCTRFGDSEAVVMRTERGRVCWTYAELHRQALLVARALMAGGVDRGTRVGILMANRPEYLSALFGTAYAGGVTVALSTFSTRDELAHLLSVADLQLLLFDGCVLKQDFAAMLADIPSPARLVILDSVTDGEPTAPGFERWEAFLASGEDSVVRTPMPDDTAGIFFSSGTTSLPKGIIHSHRAFCIQWWRWPRVFAMREPVRSWTGNGFFWSGNVSMTIGTALSTGGAVILQPTFDAESALRAIEEEKVTFLSGRPHQWARVQAASNWQTADLSSLKYVTKGNLITEHPSVNTSWTTPNAFGTTETMTICTAFDADTAAEVYAGSVGAPLPGNSLKIIDPLTGTVVPRGTRGEMCIKGPTLMQGYLGKRQEDCFDADGFYGTGDGGYVDEAGRFFWEGRLTDVIKTGGANVSPDEVDSAIAAFPGVKRTQTVGVPDNLLGEQVVACIVPLVANHFDDAALQAHLRTRLASYKCPRTILLFEDADFALTANEKPVVAEIRQKAVERLALVG
jgi:fatty-acyl-CoA synthase